MADFKTFLVAQRIVVAPFYVDDELLSHLVLGDKAKQWSVIRAMLLREGMPAPRRAMGNLYYLPAALDFFDIREGVSSRNFDGPADGSANFDC